VAYIGIGHRVPRAAKDSAQIVKSLVDQVLATVAPYSTAAAPSFVLPTQQDMHASVSEATKQS
jgi:hypothetical protein